MGEHATVNKAGASHELVHSRGCSNASKHKDHASICHALLATAPLVSSDAIRHSHEASVPAGPIGSTISKVCSKHTSSNGKKEEKEEKNRGGERETQTDRQRERETDRQTERVCVSVRECVCVSERERK